MTSIGRWLLEVAEAGGRARAAAELSRRGLTNEARSLMLKEYDRSL